MYTREMCRTTWQGLILLSSQSIRAAWSADAPDEVLWAEALQPTTRLFYPPALKVDYSAFFL